MIAQVPALCRTYVPVEMNENVQVLLAWVVNHSCDGMDGKSQIQVAVCVDPYKHVIPASFRYLDLMSGRISGGQSALRGREERGLASVPVRGCSGRILKRLKFLSGDGGEKLVCQFSSG